MSKKPIIVFEGIEGSGKSHHVSNVSSYLRKKKIDHIKIREPGGNVNSEKIRKLILNNSADFNKITDLLLYMASRSENINIIKKSLNKRIILIDRFINKFLNRFLLNNIKPTFTFLNVVNKKNLYLRLKKRKILNRYDKFNMSFYNRVQKGYLKIANLKKRSYKIINSNIDIRKNEYFVLDKIDKLIK